jgi:hypothetical protein
MSTSPQTAHGCCRGRTSGQTIRQEPEFDAERVVWDADYRRDVMERLRRWRSRHDDPAHPSMTEMKAA